MSHVFDRSGLAALSDFQTTEWQATFDLLEKHQAEFLAKGTDFRSAGYQWPLDPLHTWSRAWEYPFAYHHLAKRKALLSHSGIPRAADVGSGVTFFPFSVARLGYHVTCADIDPICADDLARASRIVSQSPGKVDFQLIAGSSLPFSDEEVDVIFCISVLEHIPNFQKTVDEMARILKHNGILILTVDVDLRGNADLSVSKHKSLLEDLSRHFVFCETDSTIHPVNVLNSRNGPFAPVTPVGLNRGWYGFKQRLKPLFGKIPRPLVTFDLAVQAFVLRRV